MLCELARREWANAEDVVDHGFGLVQTVESTPTNAIDVIEASALPREASGARARSLSLLTVTEIKLSISLFPSSQRIRWLREPASAKHSESRLTELTRTATPVWSRHLVLLEARRQKCLHPGHPNAVLYCLVRPVNAVRESPEAAEVTRPGERQWGSKGQVFNFHFFYPR
jgi:hypothetical protein